MKSTKKVNILTSFLSHSKYYVLIPLILCLLAVIAVVIFGVNTGLDYKESYTFKVDFNVEVTNKTFADYSNKIGDVINANGGDSFSYKVTKVNEDIGVGCVVKVYNYSLTDAQMENNLENITEQVETSLNEAIGNGHVNVEDFVYQAPMVYGKTLLMGGISLLVLAIIIFIYLWIRFEIKTAISSLIMLPYNIGLLASLIILFRLPQGSLFMIPLYFTCVFSYVLYCYIADKTREQLTIDNSKNNQEMVYSAVNGSKKMILTCVICFCTLFLLSMLTLSMDIISIALACLFGVVVALYTSVILSNILWALLYNKDKDKKLKNQIKNMNEVKEGKVKKTKKGEDKLVV